MYVERPVATITSLRGEHIIDVNGRSTAALFDNCIGLGRFLQNQFLLSAKITTHKL